MRRFPWEWPAGCVLGLLTGLLIAWVLAPVQYVDTSPASLRSDYKDDDRLLIASVYSATGDLGRAQARLALLGDTNPVQALTDQARQALEDGASEDAVSPLIVLAQTIANGSTAHGPTPPAATAVVVNSATPQPTEIAPFTLIGQQTLCDPGSTGNLLEIQLQNIAGQPLPGLEIQMTWPNGKDHFFTGLQPDQGEGYGDYVMTPGVTYGLQVLPTSPLLNGLAVPACQATDGTTYSGSLLLTFQQR
jgi:hypothetical protein